MMQGLWDVLDRYLQRRADHLENLSKAEEMRKHRHDWESIGFFRTTVDRSKAAFFQHCTICGERQIMFGSGNLAAAGENTAAARWLYEGIPPEHMTMTQPAMESYVVKYLMAKVNHGEKALHNRTLAGLTPYTGEEEEEEEEDD